MTVLHETTGHHAGQHRIVFDEEQAHGGTWWHTDREGRMKPRFTMDSRSTRHCGAMAENPALLTHVLRRLTFGTSPGQLATYGEASAADVIRTLLGAAPLEPELPELGTNDDYGTLTRWWAAVLTDPLAGIHERMVWFWHGHLTSSLEKAEPAQMLRQHRLLRRLALGNFRQLMQEITTDAAMLHWLDGSGSVASAPNENYAREVMELFTLGRDSGAYTEQDVRAAAVAFAGYLVDEDHGGKVTFVADNAPTGPVTLLGHQVGSAAEAIDTICDHPACAPFIASSLHTYFLGVPPAEARRDELAAVFTDSGLEVAPLVTAIVTHPSFLEARANRPRTGIEWFVALRRFYAMEIDAWLATLLGQTPFAPPNVAGWPGSERWLSTGAVFAKAQAAIDSSWDVPTLDDADPVGDVLSRAGLYEVSDETRTALQQATTAVEGRRARSSLLYALVAASPEFSLT